MALNNIFSRNFPGINVFNVSLVEETEPKDFHTRYFMFIKATPSIKSDQTSTGRSYDSSASITFKVEAEKALSLSFALNQYANGKGSAYDNSFGSFEIYADTTKSQFGSGGKKSLKVQMTTNSKTNKANINMIFSQEGSKPIAFFLSPYEAFSLSKMIEFIAMKCVELEFQGPGVVVKKQFNANNGNQKKQNEPFKEPFKATKQDQQNINSVTQGFGNIFGNSDNPFGD